jgi:transcriptional regulator with XRE-family HTH domain
MALAGRSNLAMPEDPSNSVSEPEEGRPDEDSEVEIAELLRRADLWAANGLAGLLGERLRSLREEHGFSQEELAELAGISTSLLDGIERGDERVGADLLGRIAASLGLDALQLFGELPLTDREYSTAGSLWNKQVEEGVPSFEELEALGLIGPGKDLVEWEVVHNIPERRARLFQAAGFDAEEALRWEEEAEDSWGADAYDNGSPLDQVLRAMVISRAEKDSRG